MTLTARHRISRRGITEPAGDLFGARLSIGSGEAICRRASDALAGPPASWLTGRLIRAVHVDETGLRRHGVGRPLWTTSTPAAPLYAIAEHCNRALIGTSYPGTVVSGHWGALSTATSTSGKCAGRTSSATSAATQTGS